MKENGKVLVLLPYGKGHNNIIQSNWLKILECDVIRNMALLPGNARLCYQTLEIFRFIKQHQMAWSSWLASKTRVVII